jgi:tetratricopeptide (TPR) repeat protein
VESHRHLAACLVECGGFTEGRVLAEEGVRLAEAADDLYSRVTAYCAAGFRALWQGELTQAIPVLERALDLAQGVHFRLGVPRVASFLGAAYTLAGRTAEALPLLEQAVEQDIAMHFMSDARLGIWLGEAYLSAGRLDKAGAQAQSALEFSRAHQARGHEAYALRFLGEVEAHRTPPEVARAEAHYQQALTQADALGMRPLTAHIHFDLGTLYRRMGRLGEARTALSTAIALYRAMQMTFWLPQAEAALAQAG